MATFRKISNIGKGAYGSVYLSRNKGNFGRDVAIKTNYTGLNQFGLGNLRELSILRKLKGFPYAVDLIIASFETPFEKKTPNSPVPCSSLKRDNLHFILEYIPETGSDFFKDKSRCTVNIGRLILCQLFLALEHLHTRRIVHRDLKPSNILIARDKKGFPILKLCDFGMSEIKCQSIPSEAGVSTSWYRAPEVCMGSTEYNSKIDMWAAGCIIFEVFGDKAFLYEAEDSNEGVIQAMADRYPVKCSDQIFRSLNPKSSIPPITSDVKDEERVSFLSRMGITEFESKTTHIGIEEIVKNLMGINPFQRLNATQILEMEYFNPYKEYISKIREKYPPVPPRLKNHLIKGGVSREIAFEVIIHIYNNRLKYPWYRHKIIFHAMDIFDRYLNITPSLNNSNKESIQLVVYICMYLCYKYYIILSFPISWKEFAPPLFRNSNVVRDALKFEKMLIKDVLDYEIYHDTLLEMSSFYNHKLTEDLVRKLLIGYMNIKNWNDGSVRALYRKIIGMENMS